MADYKTQLYNIAIGTQGFMLTNTPDSPARTMLQAPVFGTRFASGDREYTDFTFWWYWAQTEWANGVKDTVSWADDGKFYYSTNIDTWSEYGAIKLTSGLVLKNTFDEEITCGSYGLVGGTNYHFVGAKENAAGKATVYRSSDGTTFSNISDSDFGTSSNNTDYVEVINNLLWVGTRGLGNSSVVFSYDGTTWTDHSAAIIAAMTGSALRASSAISAISTDVYLGAEDYANDNVSLMKYDGTTWTELAHWSDGTLIYDMKDFLGNIYYLKGKSGSMVDLRVWNVSAGTDALIRTFKNNTLNNTGGNGMYLHTINGKLIITIPYKEIWSYDGSNLSRIWKRDDNKNSLGSEGFNEATGGLRYGGVYYDDKIWWANLMYDGTYFFNLKKDITDDQTYSGDFLYPLYTKGSSLTYWSFADETKLYEDNDYKGTAGKNFLVFNQIDTISTIDKLFSSCNIIFDELLTGQKIIIEYSTDGMATWTELGNVSYAVDGGTITNKTFDFSDNTIEKKMWLRVKIEGSGSTTPSLQDISIAYYPIPEYKQRWRISVNCIDDLKLLDGKVLETKRGEELRNILKTYWKDKNVLAFQDVDFAETLINEAGGLSAVNTTVTVDSTASFPEQGIIKLDKEKIKYTGRTALTFTGCTRGYEETTATTHADNLICSNGHKVIITDYSEIVPVGAEAKINEFIVTLELMET